MQNIITRTPLRVTFVGAGSDLPQFYSRSVGATVNATIDKYMYIFVHRAFDNTYRIRYSDVEDVEKIDDIRHNTAREALRLLKIPPGIEIVSLSDIPTKGTGLGSSSSYLVGLLNALHAWKGEMATKEQLAKEAVLIEKDILKEPCGLQDQYAVSFGGMNLYEYMTGERVKVSPIIIKPDDLEGLQDNLMLLYTGIRRNANDVLESARKAENFETLALRRDMTYKYYEDLISGNWKRTGHWISEGWRLKNEIASKARNSEIDRLCERVIDMGADVKNIGTGGGGFLMIFAPKAKQEKIKKELNLPELKFKFEFSGSSIILFN